MAPMTGIVFAALVLAPLSMQRPVVSEAIQDGRIGISWTQSASEGNRIEVSGQALKIVARQNTFANIYHPLGMDRVTAECRLRSAPAVSWATSIFMYWSTKDWCQIGVKPFDGGVIYVTEMENGVYSEFNLGKVSGDDWRYLRIELGVDVLRFYSADRPSKWQVEKTEDRPLCFSGAPQEVIVGKGFGGIGNYTKPNLANDCPDKGDFGTSWVSNIKVFPTPADRVHPTRAEVAFTKANMEDSLGQEMLNRKGGPTFEAIAARLPGILQPREVVGVPEHPYDIGVGWDGTVQLKDHLGDPKQPDAFLEVDGKRVGSTLLPVTKSLLPGGVPVVNLRFDQDKVHFYGQVFGWSKGMSPDAPLSAFLSLRAETSRQSSQPIHLRLDMNPRPRGWSPIQLNGRVSRNRSFHFSARADRGDDWRGFSRVDDAEVSQRLAEYRSSWEARLLDGMSLETPETRVNDSYHAWMAYNFLNVDKRKGLYEIHDGTGFYEEIYAYSAFLFCNALDLYGHHRDAEKYIDSLLTFQQPDGLLTLNYGLPDMGAMLLTMSQHHQFTGDDGWLKRVAPKILKACDWLIVARKAACTQPKGSVTYGLIKFRPYCDYPDPAFSYLSDAYAVVGMEAAAKEFRTIGLSTEAAKIETEAAVYRHDILRSMLRAKIVRDGIPILDMEPETHRLLNRSQYKGGEYYGLVAPSLLETGFLPANDFRTNWITRFMEKRGGFICGMSEFQSGVDHAYTYGYWLTCLKQGRPDRAVLGLYGSMAGAISRNTFAGVEVMHIHTGEPESTLPHTYSGTQQLRLLRMMLLREEDGCLLIGQAMPRGWMTDGKVVRLNRAPTLFGPINVSYRSDLRHRKIEVDLHPSFRGSRRLCRIWVRNPMSRPIRSVLVNGKLWKAFDRESVTVANPSNSTRIMV